MRKIDKFKPLPKKLIPSTVSHSHNSPESWDRIISKLKVLFPGNVLFVISGGAIRDYVLDLPPKDIDVFATLPDAGLVDINLELAITSFKDMKGVRQLGLREEIVSESGFDAPPVRFVTRTSNADYDHNKTIFDIDGNIFGVPVPVQLIFQHGSQTHSPYDIESIVSDFYHNNVKGWYDGERIYVRDSRTKTPSIGTPLSEYISDDSNSFANQKILNWFVRNCGRNWVKNELKAHDSLNGISRKKLLEDNHEIFFFKSLLSRFGPDTPYRGALGGGFSGITEYILFPKEVNADTP